MIRRVAPAFRASSSVSSPSSVSSSSRVSCFCVGTKGCDCEAECADTSARRSGLSLIYNLAREITVARGTRAIHSVRGVVFVVVDVV